jgi:hypothetical protein
MCGCEALIRVIWLYSVWIADDVNNLRLALLISYPSISSAPDLLSHDSSDVREPPTPASSTGNQIRNPNDPPRK